jgi:hypothetical protein
VSNTLRLFFYTGGEGTLTSTSRFDWSLVDPVYPSKTGLYSFTRDGLTQRGIEARKWLRNRPEKVIAVVSHAGFLRAGISYKKYENADFRIFDFAEGHDDIGGRLVEREMTDSKGGGLGNSGHGMFFMKPGDYPEEPEGVKIKKAEKDDEVPRVCIIRQE